jgi:hypothetical protein
VIDDGIGRVQREKLQEPGANRGEEVRALVVSVIAIEGVPGPRSTLASYDISRPARFRLHGDAMVRGKNGPEAPKRWNRLKNFARTGLSVPRGNQPRTPKNLGSFHGEVCDLALVTSGPLRSNPKGLDADST